MKYLLSIIIPIYKVEIYIQECLDSIFTQLPNNVEIILINDGTPDRSIDIVKSKYSDWLAKDQIVLLEQENAGPGAARNYGLNIARGDYIGFLDSDDILLENYFSEVVKQIYNGFDIIEFGFKRFNKVSEIPNQEFYHLYKLTGLQKMEDIRNIIFSAGVWFPSIRIYKRQFFKTLRFPEGVFYEDLMTIPYIYLLELNLYIIAKPLMGYRYNPSSTTAIHTKSHLYDMFKFFLSLDKLKDTTPIDILKVKTARSIVYFYHEIQVIDFPIKTVLNSISKIKKHREMLKCLKHSDLFFFLLPKLYMMIDKIRLKKSKK